MTDDGPKSIYDFDKIEVTIKDRKMFVVGKRDVGTGTPSIPSPLEKTDWPDRRSRWREIAKTFSYLGGQFPID